MDRCVSFGLGGPLFHEVRSAAYRKVQMPMASFIYGLGGRDIAVPEICWVFETLQRAAAGQEPDDVTYVGVRETSAAQA
jgi:pyruvate/2-oxoacid:ferredoxin oxidoreductase alpha subunit